MQRIGLTGVTGHLGKNVFEKLNVHGIQCKLLLREMSPSYTGNAVVIGDLSSSEKLSDFVQGCMAVIHCAGMVWPKSGRNSEVFETNFEGTKRLFEACKKQGIAHFIYVSSIHSMDAPNKAQAFDESAQLTSDKNKAYDFSKAEVERYLSKQDGIKITIINPTAIIGPGDKNLRGMNQLFHLLLSSKLPMVTAGGFYVIDVRTVAEALLNAILLGKTGKYIIGGRYYSIKELTSIYGEVNGVKGNKKVMPALLMRLLAILVKPIEYFVKKPLPLNAYSVETLLEVHPNILSTKATQDLELTEIPIEQTLEDLHEWFKQDFNIV